MCWRLAVRQLARHGIESLQAPRSRPWPAAWPSTSVGRNGRNGAQADRVRTLAEAEAPRTLGSLRTTWHERRRGAGPPLRCGRAAATSESTKASSPRIVRCAAAAIACTARLVVQQVVDRRGHLIDRGLDEVRHRRPGAAQPSDGSVTTTQPLAMASTARAHSKYGGNASPSVGPAAVDVEQQLGRRQQARTCRRRTRRAVSLASIGRSTPTRRRSACRFHRCGASSARAAPRRSSRPPMNSTSTGRSVPASIASIDGTPPSRSRSAVMPAARSAATP